MPFSNPAIYFRDITSTSVITPDPSDLPASQILEFTSDGNTIIEVVDNTYQNNISVDPATNPDGTKKVNLQDNGRLEDIVVVSGKIESSDSVFINKLKSFSRKLQIEPLFHTFGIFGFAYPNASSFDLDPDDTVGYSIDKIQLTVRGQAKSQVPFNFTLKTGGTLL